MTRRVLVAGAIVLAGCALVSWRAAAVALVVALVAFIAAHVVAVSYERKPRVWRAEYHAEGAPSQVEIAERIRAAQAANRLECGGMGRCRIGLRRSA